MGWEGSVIKVFVLVLLVVWIKYNLLSIDHCISIRSTRA